MAWGLTAGGLVVALWFWAAAIYRLHATRKRLDRLVDLARRGRADEARVEARKVGAPLAPLLESLNGRINPPSSRRLAFDLARVLILVGFPAGLLAYGHFTAQTGDPAERIAVVQGLFVGLALLVPASLIAATAVVMSSQRCGRALRGACFRVLQSAEQSSGLPTASPAIQRTPGRSSGGQE